MSKSPMNDKVKQIMSAIFEVPVSDINDDSSPHTIAKWDSLGHISLVTSIEEEFHVRFAEHEITEILNYRGLMTILRQRINDQGKQ